MNLLSITIINATQLNPWIRYSIFRLPKYRGYQRILYYYYTRNYIIINIACIKNNCEFHVWWFKYYRSQRCIFQYRVTGKFQLLKARLTIQFNRFLEIHEQKCYSRQGIASCCSPRSDSVILDKSFRGLKKKTSVIISAAAILRLRPRELQFDLCDSHCSKWCLRVIHYPRYSASHVA